jgi:hypothetical protein
MMPGDDAIAARRIYEVLSHPPRKEKPAPAASNVEISGLWDVELHYIRGIATHTLNLEEKGGDVTGQHRGEFLSGGVRGSRTGSHLSLRSAHRYEGTAVTYRFDGTIATSEITGTVDLAEYGKAQFTARRHQA